MDCTHGTPGGSQRCALCRRQVLDLHKVRHREWAWESGDRPMPENFRELLQRSRPRPTPVQPPLDLED